MRWMKVAVQAAAECEEAITQILLAVGAQGVMLEGAGPARTVIAYLPEQAELSAAQLERQVRDLGRYGLSAGDARVSIEWVQDEDWAESWKRHYKPLPIGRRLLVKPAWVEVPRTDRHVIELDPGMAFGTGYHPTTALCLEALEEVVAPGVTVVDVGTGSGILAIAAALLGAGSVVAVDIDPQAVEAARQNCRRNGVDDRVWVAAGSAGSARALLAGRRAQVVVANILADVIAEMAVDLHSLLVPGGTLVASGIIDHASESVRTSLAAAGFTLLDERARGEWRCLLAARDNGCTASS